jgi:His/Glu/Gln/Arg/opine family amino acid ABC transporter permease subunit
MILSVVIEQLLSGMVTSIEIFLLTLLFSLPLGLLIAAGRMSKIGPIRWLMKIYISIMRGTPLMLQLIVVFFAPYYVFGFNLSSDYRFIAVIIAFTINYAAYFAEIYRGGIESINSGQYEAAQVLGYSKLETFFIIIMPQVIKVVLPSITNEVITLVKDTSLSFVIAIPEMFTVAKQIAAADASIVALLVAGLFYYVFNILVAFAMEYLEKRLDYYE